MGTEYTQATTCMVTSGGNLSAAVSAQLHFDALQPLDFAVRIFNDLKSEDEKERWTIPVSLFDKLRGLDSTTTTTEGTIEATVIWHMSFLRKQVLIEFDLNGRPPTTLMIPRRDIKRFMKLIKQILTEDPQAVPDYLDGERLRFIGRY